MRRYGVRVAESALADMREIEEYIAGRLGSPAAAARQYERIAREILSLDTMPARFGVPDLGPCEELGLHRMLVDGYSVFFLIDGEDVVVTDVLYSASDLARRLDSRR